MITVVFLMAIAGGSFLPQTGVAAPDICGDVADCRAEALAARGAHQYERFHDLAWRAVQKGKPNDPQLMYLLARAQSLSGRPDDALVMLGRLADLGVIADAETNPDFARVRDMSTWPALDARLRALGPPTITSSGEAGPVAPARAGPSLEPASNPSAAAAPASPAKESAAPPSSEPRAGPAPTPDFDTSAIAPIALAHDEVSRRFVLADGNAARLVIIDDLSHHVVTLVSRDAGFYDHITGFTIDDRRGDLWVTSTTDDADAAASRLHKLQLVSGRVLEQIEAPARTKLVDVAVASDGTVYGLDGAGSRLLELHPGAKSMDVVMPIGGGSPIAMASGGDMLYVATASGIAGINPVSRSSSPLRSSQALAGIQALAWIRGGLVAVQHRDSGSSLILLSLDRSGLRVTSVRLLASAADHSPVTIERRTAYYLAAPGVIGHVDLK